jgi:4-hydroxy-tetrahydrodipicolinate reductase
VYGHIGDCSGDEVDVGRGTFPGPEALPPADDWCRRNGKALVVATTGLSQSDHALLRETSAVLPVFQSANMSVGVNLIMDLCGQAAAALGADFDVEIVEMHHNQKIDAPSGTALALADAVNEALPEKREYVYGRHSRTNRRTRTEIGIHAIRGGTLSGEHQVLFLGADEMVEFRHSAQSRQIFALGALRAARFLAGKPAGFYTMKDLLLENRTVTGLYADADQALITVRGLPCDGADASALFDALAGGRINLDMISQTAPAGGRTDISFTLPPRDADLAVRLIEQALGLPAQAIDVRRGIVKLSVEGPGMARQSGVASRLLAALSRNGVAVYAITSSETKISCCVDKSLEKTAAGAIVSAFDYRSVLSARRDNIRARERKPVPCILNRSRRIQAFRKE